MNPLKGPMEIKTINNVRKSLATAPASGPILNLIEVLSPEVALLHIATSKRYKLNSMFELLNDIKFSR
ncbi:hypothetical protein A4A36_11985 [Bacillus subtilis]|nr:hypothetical protein C1T29_01620 [Bacillus sp. MBGLi79]OIS63950.1 hypothetical protein A4A35_10230 [Bacillus subtilis]OIS69267.1 hypothetical protein A4A37_10085 [Bacillus subtilis]OIS69776.1 hypothetical protein A4A36_11985 [Bacillus subtilis]POO79902.1 hypothetical protein C1T30_26385 [Bacillus sp. MBGLi97]